MRVGNWAVKDAPVNLGDLKGNHFTIILRDLALVGVGDSLAQEKMVEGAALGAVADLKRTGFINYYGLQRFGTGVNPTHKVGAQLLQRNYEAAVKMILEPMMVPHGGNDGPEFKSNHFSALRPALEAFRRDGDAGAALKLFPRNGGSTERSLLESLANKPGDWRSAIGSIPRTTRSLYLHAWQGYVWNRAVSARILEGGVEGVAVGDLVWSEEATAPKSKWDGTETQQPSKMKLRGLLAVKLIETTEDASKYSITDVVVPLPGFDVTYPRGAAGEAIRKASCEMGVDLDAHIGQRRTGPDADLSLSGDYRHLLCRPTDFEAEVVRYVDPNADIEPSDYWACQGKQSRAAFGPEDEDRSNPADVQRLAVKLKFTLPPGAYATMLIRELTKMPTDVDAHRTYSMEQRANANADVGPDGSTMLPRDD